MNSPFLFKSFFLLPSFFFFQFLSSPCHGQIRVYHEEKYVRTPFSDDNFLEIKDKDYRKMRFSDDSTFQNIQNYTPSVLLKKGQVEFKNFNSIYTETAGFDQSGSKYEKSGRSTFFTSINQLLLGVGTRLNIGADIWLRASRYDNSKTSSFDILRFENNATARTALTYAGPKIKFAPFKKMDRLSVQSSFLFPIDERLEGDEISKPYIDEDRYLWVTHVFYDQPLGENFQLFTRFFPWVSIDRYGTGNNNSLATPLSAFLSYFAGRRFTFYLQNEFWPTYGSQQLLSSYFWQEGVGVKYQPIIGTLEVEMLYTRFLAGKNTGAGQTFNFGLRWLR